jgi:hypothetical protein
MASNRDEAFERFVDGLAHQDWGAGRALVRKAWEAGRCYEVERIAAIAQHRATLTSREDDQGRKRTIQTLRMIDYVATTIHEASSEGGSIERARDIRRRCEEELRLLGHVEHP